MASTFLKARNIVSSAEVEEMIVNDIQTGALKPGDLLLTVTETHEKLAKRFGTKRKLHSKAVVNAYASLCNKGVLMSRGRTGTFVAEFDTEACVG